MHIRNVQLISDVETKLVSVTYIIIGTAVCYYYYCISLPHIFMITYDTLNSPIGASSEFDLRTLNFPTAVAYPTYDSMNLRLHLHDLYPWQNL